MFSYWFFWLIPLLLWLVIWLVPMVHFSHWFFGKFCLLVPFWLVLLLLWLVARLVFYIASLLISGSFFWSVLLVGSTDWLPVIQVVSWCIHWLLHQRTGQVKVFLFFTEKFAFLMWLHAAEGSETAALHLRLQILWKVSWFSALWRKTHTNPSQSL